MQDVMYGRLDSFPQQLLHNSSKDDDDDENLLDPCCPTSHESMGKLSDGTADRRTPHSGEFRVASLAKLACVTAVALIVFVVAYNVIVPVPPSLFEQQPSTPLINSSRANSLLMSVCNAVAFGQHTGDICDWLCAAERNYTVTGYYNGGSKTVLKLNRNGRDLILKTHHINLDDYDSVDPRVDDDEFTDKVIEIVNEQLHMDWPIRYKSHLIRTLWPLYRINQTMTNAERQSLWALTQQEEFIQMKALTQTRVTPKVLGSCAHLYQVEYMIPFKMKAYYMNLKAKILVHLMGTLKLFYEFLNEPLQWCDVKFENLGLLAKYPRRFMVLDSDMLYTDSKLNRILTSQKCTADEECNLFDCHSSCNNSTGYCSPRTNDNVDVFCEKLINRLFGTFWSKSNKYLSACYDKTISSEQRLSNLRYVWAWSFVNV